MANRCAGLDPTWAHLPAPAAGHCAPAPWLFPAAAFENEALTCALRASMAPANPGCASSSYPTTPTSSSTSELLSGGHDAPAPASRPAGLPGKPKEGRVAKRKPRPSSRRPPPTYIVTDPANFRRMVQEVTGFPAAASSGARPHPAPASAAARSRSPTPPPSCVLPTLDTSAFLLDRAVAAPVARVAEDMKSSSGRGASPATTTAEEEGDHSSSVFRELEAAMACAPPAFLADEFPTLESWGII